MLFFFFFLLAQSFLEVCYIKIKLQKKKKKRKKKKKFTENVKNKLLNYLVQNNQ